VASGAMGTGASAPVFLSSTDGGSSWSNAAAPPNFTGVSGLSCPSGGSCVAVGHAMSGSTPVSSTATLSSPTAPNPQWASAPTPAVQPAS
jgi:hypothetical protein